MVSFSRYIILGGHRVPLVLRDSVWLLISGYLFFLKIILVFHLSSIPSRHPFIRKNTVFLLTVSLFSFLSVWSKSSLTFCASCSLFIIQLYCVMGRRKWTLECYLDYSVVAMERSLWPHECKSNWLPYLLLESSDEWGLALTLRLWVLHNFV